MKKLHTLVFVLVLLLGYGKPLSQTLGTIAPMPRLTNEAKRSVVFITGFDEGDNTYYTNAENYFLEQGLPVVKGLFSLEEVITWLNRSAQINFDEVHIVSHSNAWMGMSLKTTKNGQRITVKTLQQAKGEHKIPELKRGIHPETKVMFHSCGLGENTELLQELKRSFSGTVSPKVYASAYFNVFGGKFAGHYLAKPYYGYYPTAESPGPLALTKAFRSAYPETKIDWRKAMKTRSEAALGEAYSFKFNIPVTWEFSFDTVSEVPVLDGREAIMDWVAESPEMAEVLLELNIPLEKFRWKSEVQGKKMTIKAKTTVLCVLEPVLSHCNEEYRMPVAEETTLYQIL